MAASVQKKLAEITLSIDTTDLIVTVLIISKSEPNYFLAKDSSEYRGVITFTVRDSKIHLTNCKFWGTKEKVEEYHRNFHINDIIDIYCPQIGPQPFFVLRNNLSEDIQQQQQRFQPLTTTPYLLILNEGKGFIEKHTGDDFEKCRQLWALARVPHKPFNTVLNLADIKKINGNSYHQNFFVDLLVVVGKLNPLKEVRSKRTGIFLKYLKIIVLDRSVISGMELTIWNSDWIKRAQQFWTPMQTVLFLIDIRVGYSEFCKATVLSVTNRTLMYENPIGKESDELVKFAETVPVSNFDLLAHGNYGNLPSAESITDVMTVKQIYDRAEGNLKDDSEQFTAVLLALITKFDIDGLTSIIRKKCKSCGRQLFSEQNDCDFDQCSMNFSFNFTGEKFEKLFNINIHFSDNTGTLIEAWLSGVIAERILGINAIEFEKIDEKHRENLKWDFLMELFEVKLLIKKKTSRRKNLNISIVDMKRITLEKASTNIVVY